MLKPTNSLLKHLVSLTLIVYKLLQKPIVTALMMIKTHILAIAAAITSKPEMVEPIGVGSNGLQENIPEGKSEMLFILFVFFLNLCSAT